MSPPVIILGGGANALSVARSLSRAGIEVYAIGYTDDYHRYSRHATWIACNAPGTPAQWLALLTGPETAALSGAVLLTCSDEAIELVCDHHAELGQRYILEEGAPPLRRALLDKLATYRIAEKAGVPTPQFWTPKSLTDITDLADRLSFPLIIKPLLRHHFEEVFRCKYLRAENMAALKTHFSEVASHGLEVKLVEFIPGPDSQLASYYTYFNDDAAPLFHFTKRVIRRFPSNMGGASYHITDRNPQVQELGLKFFHAAGLRGLGNVEFKLDTRDGQLKLIECNARFTAANSLVTASGIDLALLVYNALTGRPLPQRNRYAENMRLWRPVQDFAAFRELHARGELPFLQWLESIAHRQTFEYFDMTDPFPFAAAVGQLAKQQFRSMARRLGSD